MYREYPVLQAKKQLRNISFEIFVAILILIQKFTK